MTREQVLPLVLEAMPSLAARWEEEGFDESGADEDDPGARLDYVDEAAAVHAAVDLLAQGQTSEVVALLAVVERMINEGDNDVQRLAVVGFIEDLGNVLRHREDVGDEDLVPLLGPRARQEWERVEGWWNGTRPFGT